jgi:tetratricopeptide (TPR) repeat protein
LLLWYFTRPPSCERAFWSGDMRRGVEVCRASHARTGNVRDLSWAAQAHMYLGELDQAEELAGQLLTGPLLGDGHRILSFVTLRRGSGDAARWHASLAVFAHTLAGDERALQTALVMRAQAAWQVGDFTASLDAADKALTLARRLNAPRKEVAAHLARADALRRMGDRRGATDAVTRAIARATEPCDKAWAYLKKGMCQMEAEKEGLAALDLKSAAQANGRCRSRSVSTAVTLNEAWLLRRKDPRGALAKLDEVTKSEGDLLEALLLRGYLAADRGALVEADRYLTQAASLDPPDADWTWEIASARAALFEQRGDDLRAESQYREATELVASLRGSARARSAYLVASHRRPYDGLIALLARKGRWRDVLAVVLDLDASDMLRATADQVVSHQPSPSAPVGDSIATPPPPLEDVLSAWRSRDLVIVIAPSRRQIGPGLERAYRLRVMHGEVTGEDVSDASTARRWAEALFADPGDKAAARALGPMIVPPGASDEILHVLAIGPLGKAPLAALRDADGSLSSGRRPLVRVLALRATRPESSGTSPPVVMADPQGDLPGAAMEGAVVARALGAGARVSGSGTSFPATRARLWEARDAELLFVAAHVVNRGHRRALRLADSDIGPAEMVRGRLAPRLAVLASCGSAAAMDEEGWGSIAAALLESGTAKVLATDRSIDDAASLTVMRDFYAQPDWRADPARALTRVQRALDARAATSSEPATQPRAWAAFSVLHRPPVVPGR